MSQIELPDPVYGALQQAAQAAGVTPQAWIAARLAEKPNAPQPVEATNVSPPKTMADLFAGQVGRIRTGKKNLSEQSSAEFAKDLEAKRRAGHL
jgi:hypothetical protein